MSKARGKRWVARVQATSDAMDLEPHVFKERSAKRMAQSILRSVKRSRRRKGTVLSSGISMLTFYANRGGSKLSPARKKTIQAAKEEYRKLVREKKE